MKKEIENLLKLECGMLTLNQYTYLRWNNKVDVGRPLNTLEVIVHLTGKLSYTRRIVSRDWRGIIKEVVLYQRRAFEDASEELNKQLLNGYKDKEGANDEN